MSFTKNIFAFLFTAVIGVFAFLITVPKIGLNKNDNSIVKEKKNREESENLFI